MAMKLVHVSKIKKGVRFRLEGEIFEIKVPGNNPVVKNLDQDEIGNLSTFIDAAIEDARAMVAEEHVIVKEDALAGFRKQVIASKGASSISSGLIGQGTITIGQVAQPLSSDFAKKQLRTDTKVGKLESEVGKIKLGAGLVKGRLDSIENAAYDAKSIAEEAQRTAGFSAKVSKEASRIQDEKLAEVSRRVGKLEVKNELTKTKEENSMNLQQKFAQKSQEVAARTNLQEKFAAKSASKNKGVNGLLNGFKGLFGKVEGRFAFSIATGGLAIKKSDGTFVSYKDGILTDVTGLTLDFNVPAFKLPVAASEIKAGDIVLNNGNFGYVVNAADGYVETIVPEKGSKGSVLPVTNALLGQSFYTVVRTLDAAGNGGFDPMLLLALGDGNKEDLLPLLLMGGGFGGNGAQAGAIDPMTLMLLQDKTDDLLPLILLQQGGLGGAGFNPLFLLLGDDKGSKSDLLPFLLMQQGGGLFGQTPQAQVTVPAVEVKTDKK